MYFTELFIVGHGANETLLFVQDWALLFELWIRLCMLYTTKQNLQRLWFAQFTVKVIKMGFQKIIIEMEQINNFDYDIFQE